MKSPMWRAIAVAIFLPIGLLAVPPFRFLFFGLPEERLDGSQFAESSEIIEAVDPESRGKVAQALLEAGLNDKPKLTDIGVVGHLSRLDAGEVSAKQLVHYAEGLEKITLYSGRLGRRIPPAFWDVDSDVLNADGWDAYRVVAALSSPEGRPYLNALTAAYRRFYAFKTSRQPSKDTALDTALDLFEPCSKLISALPPEHRLETSKFIRNKEQATLYFWQQIVVGATRTNPITHTQIFNHGFTSRFHVGEIWQYETGIAEGNSAIWGVSGFAPEFVGPLENNNQVEHMSISMTAQGILREPLLILKAFERFESFRGSASKSEADADNALNVAVKEYFISGFESNLPNAVAALRRRLKTAR